MLRTLFEIFGYSDKVWQLLEDEVYKPAMFIILVVNLAVAFYFYRLLTPNRSIYNQMKHWILAMLVSASLATVASWFLARIKSVETGCYDCNFFDFSEFLMAVFFWSLISFFIYSLFLKKLNPSRSHLPLKIF